MFWIFGGGLEQGSPDGYDGIALASQGRTIVVTVNYCLNVFGFLLHPALRTNGHLYGDYGLLDQQFGMKWVQQNIAKFGGDPNNITIFGESGGSQLLEAIFCLLWLRGCSSMPLWKAEISIFGTLHVKLP
jgi:para-nitrobenzyl esterase